MNNTSTSGGLEKYDSVKSLFNKAYSLLNLEYMIKINKEKFMVKLVNKEQAEFIQMNYYLQEINALNKNKDKKQYIISGPT